MSYGLVLEGRGGLGVLVVGASVVVQRSGSSRVEAYPSSELALLRASVLVVANENQHAPCAFSVDSARRCDTI